MTEKGPARRRGTLDDEGEDKREMCFEQGKPCVYEPEERPGTILTEWPNGTVDAHDLEARTRTRKWPDGREETASDDEPVGYPHWPRRQDAEADRSRSESSVPETRFRPADPRESA